MPKVISVISAFPGSGQTTIAVNLAAALAREGNKVLLLNLGNGEKLSGWLDVNVEQAEGPGPVATDAVYHSRRGIDLFIHSPSDNVAGKAMFLNLQQRGYDYVFLLPASKGDCQLIAHIPGHVLVCTDLSHIDEVQAVISLAKVIKDLGKDGLDLIVPNKINTKEWEHNSGQLFTLADYFGYEKIADPIPYCERVHDLPLTGQTIWEINRENLKGAFNSLVEKALEL